MAINKTKRLIHVTREQEEKMAAQSAQKIQAFIGEANQIQARRCEVFVALMAAEVTRAGVPNAATIAAIKATADEVVRLDAHQKFSDLKALLAELEVGGPQPHLEWAAKQLGITLFDEPAEEPLVVEAKVIQ